MFEPITLYITQHHIGEYASIIGLVVTIIGFGITIFNVSRSKSAAIQAENAVLDMKNDVRLYQTVDNFARAVTLMEEIKRMQRQKDWSLLPDRYSSLRKALVNIRFENPFLTVDDQKEIQAAVTQFSNLEALVDGVLSKDGQNVDISQINKMVSKQIDRIYGLLVKLKAQIGIKK